MQPLTVACTGASVAGDTTMALSRLAEQATNEISRWLNVSGGAAFDHFLSVFMRLAFPVEAQQMPKTVVRLFCWRLSQVMPAGVPRVPLRISAACTLWGIAGRAVPSGRFCVRAFLSGMPRCLS